MAYKPQNPTSLGGDNEVSWERGSNLVIGNATDESFVVLQPKEISRLLSFLISRVTDKQINELLNELQNVTNAFYCSANARWVNHHQAVRDWLATLDQSPTTKDK